MRCYVVVAISLAACTIDNSFQIEPGARADSLAFKVLGIDGRGAPGSRVYGLSVVMCGTGQAMWTVSTDGSRSMPPRVVYGQTVQGYPARAGPLPLTAGCYDVFMTGAPALRFDVDKHGAIHVRPTAP